MVVPRSQLVINLLCGCWIYHMLWWLITRVVTRSRKIQDGHIHRREQKWTLLGCKEERLQLMAGYRFSRLFVCTGTYSDCVCCHDLSPFLTHCLRGAPLKPPLCSSSSPYRPVNCQAHMKLKPLFTLVP